jgi:hypothetical protein
MKGFNAQPALPKPKKYPPNRQSIRPCKIDEVREHQPGGRGSVSLVMQLRWLRFGRYDDDWLIDRATCGVPVYKYDFCGDEGNDHISYPPVYMIILV